LRVDFILGRKQPLPFNAGDKYDHNHISLLMSSDKQALLMGPPMAEDKEKKLRKILYNQVLASQFRSLELILITAYPPLLFYYLFTSLFFSPPGQDLQQAYLETTWGTIGLSLALYAFYSYTYLATLYICKCDPMVGNDPTVGLPILDLDDTSQIETTKTPFGFLKFGAPPQTYIKAALPFFGPIATGTILYTISGWSVVCFLPFYVVVWMVGETLLDTKARLPDQLLIYPAASFVLLLFVGYYPNLFGSVFGSIGVVVICCIGWVGLIGSLLIRLRSTGSMLLFVGLPMLLAGYLVSLFVPASWMAMLSHSEVKPIILTGSRTKLKDLGEEYRQRFVSPQTPAPPHHHVIFVAAAGGGLRAAIWTEAVLRTLQQELPGFTNSVFAISGVSGGALGAAHFLAENADRDITQVSCLPTSAARNGCINRFMQTDFLAAPIASSLSTDFPSIIFGRNSFTNLFNLFPRRDDSLIAGWERSWKKIRGTDHFGEPFLDLWKHENPGLIVNATSQIFGDRVLISNLDISQFYNRDADHPPNLAAFEISLGQAVSLGARFPILSEAAAFEVAPNTVDELVDGGYFDNFGAATIDQLISYLERREHLSLKDVIVVQITNDRFSGNYLSVPILDASDPAVDAKEKACAADPITEYIKLPTILQPLGAMDAVRTARGLDSAAKLHQRTKGGGGIYVHFGLLDIEAPLSWSLSKRVNDQIWDRLNCAYNKTQIDILKQRW
jgi:hypothetical protein